LQTIIWLNNLNVLPIRVGIPISITRLIGAAVTGVFIVLLLYSTQVNQSWITLCIYVLVGVTVGAVLGWYEAKTVLSRIKTDPLIIQWKLATAAGVLVILPFVFISGLYGFLESRNFLSYTVLTALPIFLATSGFEYTNYEKQNKVQIISGPNGFRYWLEPVREYSDKFYYFLRDIETKDTAAMWYHAGYSRIYRKELEKQNLSKETKENIGKILKTLRAYQIAGLTILAIIALGFPLLIIFSFTNGFGLLEMPLNAIMNITMPILAGLFITVGVSTFLLMYSLKKKMTETLPQIRIEKI
jgi:hypothetical protein